MSAPATDRLFVYGTLLRAVGHPMYRLLARQADYLGPAQVAGRLYDLGDYPGMLIEAGGAAHVTGELYRLHDPATTLRQLDQYEGCAPTDRPPREFERVLATATISALPPQPAWVYVYGRNPTALPRIADGDYLAHRARRAVAPAPTTRAPG